MTSVDVIIPVYRPDEKLNRLLAALENQTVKPERIILIHTGEVLEGEPDYRPDVVLESSGKVTETKAGMVEAKVKAAEVKAETVAPEAGLTETKPRPAGRACRILCNIPRDSFDHGGSRNLGASFSTAGVMVFMTQDAVPADERLLEKLLVGLGETTEKAGRSHSGETKDTKRFGCGEAESAERTVAAVAYARQLPYEDCKAVERYIREFNYPEKSELRTKADLKIRGIKTFCNSNVCSAYRRDVFDQLGGFAEKTIFNEDMLFGAKAVQADFGVAYAADARVYHSHNLGLSDQFHRNFDNGVSQAEHPEVFAAVSSEKEGMKLVKYCISRMKEDRKLYLVPYFILNCVCRYAGFFLGKRYQKLPKGLVRACSLNKRYWN